MSLLKKSLPECLIHITENINKNQELPRETGRFPHPGVCPQSPSRPSPQGATTRALTSRLSHPQQVTQDGGRERARGARTADGVPKARQAWRGGPPASQERLLLSPLAQASSRSQTLGITTEAVSSGSSQPAAQPLCKGQCTLH